ncbi:tetraspanin-33 [Biomphalaria glabrata]|uniref:Tetraspanin n=1 Tax=Biomphalaria glabrata TaxID=6526 RepID=A0A2C9LR95_BIOGL|nr:tetraspanin-33-like [Biomphalaria glabrata]KAI8768452.1 tetraspanin-33-like [Biomphalaria glabrata]KAI8777621.1 tetraspanin-33 [Biomphalaria glabrata]
MAHGQTSSSPNPQAQRQRRQSRGPSVIQDRINNTLRRRRKKPDYSAVNPFVKYVLFFTNFIFILVGIAFAAVGIYILSLKNKTVTSFIDFIFDPACILCLAGCIILAVAFFGCGGALRESRLFLKIYYIILSLLLLLEILLVIFIFVFYFVDGAFAKIGLYPEEAFSDAVKKYRDDPDMQGFIDNIQDLLSCCGASNDDNGYLDWNKNSYFNCSTGNPSPEACSVPFSCCKIKPGENINYRCGADMLKKDQVNISSIYVQGCFKGLQEVIKDNIWIVGGTILGIFIPQAFFICLAKALISQIEEQMAKW